MIAPGSESTFSQSLSPRRRQTLANWKRHYRCASEFIDPESGYPYYCLNTVSQPLRTSAALSLIKYDLVLDVAYIVIMNGDRPLRVRGRNKATPQRTSATMQKQLAQLGNPEIAMPGFRPVLFDSKKITFVYERRSDGWTCLFAAPDSIGPKRFHFKSPILVPLREAHESIALPREGLIESALESGDRITGEYQYKDSFLWHFLQSAYPIQGKVLENQTTDRVVVVEVEDAPAYRERQIGWWEGLLLPQDQHPQQR